MTIETVLGIILPRKSKRLVPHEANLAAWIRHWSLVWVRFNIACIYNKIGQIIKPGWLKKGYLIVLTLFPIPCLSVQAKVKCTNNWISDALARTWKIFFFNKGGKIYMHGPSKLEQLVEQSVLQCGCSEWIWSATQQQHASSWLLQHTKVGLEYCIASHNDMIYTDQSLD